MEKKRSYIPVKFRFIFTIVIAIIWVAICFIIDRAWFWTLVAVLGMPAALAIVFGIAIIPGVMICFYSLGGLFFDRPVHYKDIPNDALEPITILIAAYNEEESIYDTIKSIAVQDYPSQYLTIKVIDNNSKDKTREEIFKAALDFPQLNIQYLFQPVQGKFAALNMGVAETQTRFYITIDADTYLYKDALKTLVYDMVLANRNGKRVGAVAGTVLVRNSRQNLMTKLQEWEYFLSIATIKRSQGLFQTTMVAQGAFSIYDTQLVREIGGYKPAMAEDIVLTWELLSQQDSHESPVRTYYCDDAIVFTNVPTTFKQFVRQRFRWARGSIEGFRAFSFRGCHNFYTKFYMFVNYTNIIGELGTTFILIPGIILALVMHNFLFVSICTVILFIVTVLIYQIMFYKQVRYVFKPIGLKVRKHYIAFIIYMLFFAMVLAPICLVGYGKEILRTKHKW